uniref:Uncharacterized protein n=1 Tax=Cucumis melo TaxID=3656 RepID=A0A9I9EL66_CUCME
MTYSFVAHWLLTIHTQTSIILYRTQNSTLDNLYPRPQCRHITLTIDNGQGLNTPLIQYWHVDSRPSIPKALTSNSDTPILDP